MVKRTSPFFFGTTCKLLHHSYGTFTGIFLMMPNCSNLSSFFMVASCIATGIGSVELAVLRLVYFLISKVPGNLPIH